MTIVAIGKFKEGAVIMSDSRASYNIGRHVSNDSLQKIIPIGNKGIFCYAGSVSMANKILEKLKNLNSKKRDYKYLDGVIKNLPGLAKFVYNSSPKQEQEMGLSIFIGGKLISGEISFWKLNWPNFVPIKVNTYDVIGSGSIVRDYLDNNIQHISSLSSLKEKVDTLIHGLTEELSMYGIESVGGMFQVFLLTNIGIQPFEYGYIDLDPNGKPDSMSMTMIEGRWIQNNHAQMKETPVLMPGTLLTQPVTQKVIRNYITENVPVKDKKWYLNYFMTCAGVKIMPNIIEFHSAIVIGQSIKFPIKTKLILAIGFWGAAGSEIITITKKNNGNDEVICEIPFEIKFFPEDIDVAKEIEITINKPGLVILEAKIKNKIIGKRVLFFREIREEEVAQMMKGNGGNLDLSEIGKNELIKQVDPSVNDKPELVYSFLCQSYKNENNIESFENQFWVAYWKKYPLPLACHIVSAFRLSRGNHTVRVDLVDTASHQKICNITTTSLESRSSCLISPIHGNFVINIPKAGYFYINTYVDDILTATHLLIAETNKPKYSYSLQEKELEEIENGQLILLSKRSTKR